MNAKRGMLNLSYKSNFADCLLLMGRLLLSILTDVITIHVRNSVDPDLLYLPLSQNILTWTF